MKAQKKNSPKNVVKGAPSGLVISLLVHAAAFMLAGLLVVFNVVQKEEKKFVPPKPVDRPKMKLKKPKVKVRKSAKPRSTTRIVTKVQKASMPDIQLPEMSGMTAGLAGDIGGFEIMPDLDEITVFGGGQTIGNDFVGTLYDFKRTRSGGPTGMDYEDFLYELARFTKTDWKPSRLAKFYQAPKKLYTTTFMVPTMNSAAAPTAFGEPDMIGYAWAVHYKGQIVHPVGGRFRFWAQGDDVIIVRLNGEIVVDGSVSDVGEFGSFREILTGFVHTTADSMKYYMGERQAQVGTWFTLEPGVPLDMEVLIGESPGGSFSAMLAVQEEGVEYPKSPQGGPLVPMFKTAEPNHATLDAIYEHFVVGEADLHSGPIFCDFGSGYSKVQDPDRRDSAENLPEPMPQEAGNSEPAFRVWATTDGQSVEARFITFIGDKVVLKTARNKQIKIPHSALSPADIEFIELSNPPEFKISFRALSSQRQIASRTGEADVPTALQWRFGAKIEQASSRDYPHEVEVEYYALGQQIQDRNKYILIDRGRASFTPCKENGRSYEFINDNEIELMKYTVSDQSAGRKKSGHLIVIRDNRGEIIQHDASNKWVWEQYEKLSKLPVGAFMDDTGNRVYPTGLKPTQY